MTERADCEVRVCGSGSVRSFYTWRSRCGNVRSLEHLEEQTAIQWPGRSKGNIWGSCFLASNRMFCPDVFTETLQEQRQAWVLVNVVQSVSFERCFASPPFVLFPRGCLGPRAADSQPLACCEHKVMFVLHKLLHNADCSKGIFNQTLFSI